jgi:hypothetical protein
MKLFPKKSWQSYGQKQFTWLIVHEHGKSGSCGIFMASIEFSNGQLEIKNKIMQGWTYRIVKKGEQYGFWLVFVDENGDIVKIDEKPEAVYASSMEGLEEKFDLIKDAWENPVIDYNTGEES